MARFLQPVAALLAAIALVLGAEGARASGFLVPAGARRAPTSGWSLEQADVRVVVRGPHARVTVEQVFRNHGTGVLEADYVFPLPAGAMVSSMTLHEGAQVLKGRLLRAAEARAAYLEIVRRRKDPALLQYLGRNLYRVRAFPIPPGQARTVVLTYDQTLAGDGGLTEFVYPLGAGGLSAGPGSRVTVELDLQTKAPLGALYSPTHDVGVVRKGAHHAVIRYTGVAAGDAQDLLLYWGTTSRRIGATLLTYWPEDEPQGWYLVLATPGLAHAAGSRARPKSVSFVVDVSGSMAGEKLEQVRAALTQVIGGLDAGDRFNVIAYHSTVAALWPEAHAATPVARREALAFVERLKAAGGTNIEGALRTALAAPRPQGVPSVLVFLTDGRPTMGETDPERILASIAAVNPGGATRVFVLGVGVDVNAVLLDRLALENKGAPAFVRPRESVEVKVSALCDKIRYPVLTDVTFEARGMQASDMLPQVLPDVFRGSELLLAGRYAAGGPVELVLRGRDGAFEREFHYALTAARRGAGVASDFPARVWATRRIAQLLDAIRLHKKRDPELVNEIVRLSTRFGILTEYTSFLADETGVSHAALTVNALRTLKNLDALTTRVVGGAGLAQSANQAERRKAARVTPSTGAYYSTPDDRDVQKVRLRGVRQVGNRTFYFRGKGTGWVDVRASQAKQPDEVVTRWSARFFEILATTTADENARLAQAGPLLLEVQGRILRVLDPS